MSLLIKDYFEKLFWIQNQIKFCHWKETSGWRHKVLGKFYAEMDDKIDTLVESIAGIFGDSVFEEMSDGMYKVNKDMELEELIKDVHAIFFELRNFYSNKSEVLDSLSGIVNLIEEIIQIVSHTNYMLQRV